MITRCEVSYGDLSCRLPPHPSGLHHDRHSDIWWQTGREHDRAPDAPPESRLAGPMYTDNPYYYRLDGIEPECDP